MFKKIVISSLAVVAGLFIVNSTHLGAYARTAWQKVKHTAQSQVPLEYQLDVVCNELAQLTPDMRKAVNVIAVKTVAVENLRSDIVAMRKNLEGQNASVARLNNDLKSAMVQVKEDGRHSANRLRDRLARELASSQRCSKQIESKEALLEAEEKGLDSAREQLASMRVQKEQLEVRIAQIRAELGALRVAETNSKVKIDDSRTSMINGKLTEIENEIKVRKAESEMLSQFSDGSSEPKVKSAAELTKEADEFLGETKTEGVTAKR